MDLSLRAYCKHNNAWMLESLACETLTVGRHVRFDLGGLKKHVGLACFAVSKNPKESPRKLASPEGFEGP
jgi:hypothetical protein